MVTVSFYPIIQKDTPRNSTAVDATPHVDLMMSIKSYVMILVRPVHDVPVNGTIHQTSHHWIFFLWGHLQSVVYDDRPRSTAALQNYISAVCATITSMTLWLGALAYGAIFTCANNMTGSSLNIYSSKCTNLCDVRYARVAFWTCNILPQLATLQHCFCIIRHDNHIHCSSFVLHLPIIHYHLPLPGKFITLSPTHHLGSIAITFNNDM